MNYQDNSALFWINTVGHEAMSVLSLVETKKSFSGTSDQLSHMLQLRTSKLDVLKLLGAFGLINFTKVGVLHTIFSTGLADIPPWGLFVQQMSDAIRIYKKSDVAKINWQSVFAAVDAATAAPVRVGLGTLDTVEIITRADKHDPRLIINSNQKPNGSGFSFVEIERGDFVCVCSHRVGSGETALPVPPLKIKLKPSVVNLELDAADEWRSKPVPSWTAVDLSAWIMQKYIDTYDSKPPFNRLDVQRSGILKSGVYALARAKSLEEDQYMIGFQKYVEWLCGHKTFSLSISSLVSSRTMGIYCVEEAKAAKHIHTGPVGIPAGQNLTS